MIKRLSIFLSLFLIVGHLAAIVPSNVLKLAFGFSLEGCADNENDQQNADTEASDDEQKENEEQNEKEFIKDYLLSEVNNGFLVLTTTFWIVNLHQDVAGPAIALLFPPPEA